MTEPWYVSAFGAHYNDLYHHRDNKDARRAIAFLRRAGVLASPDKPVLDLCCGSGRHCIEWLQSQRAAAVRPFTVGLDLAPNLLADAARSAQAKGLSLPLLRGDMRRLPFRDQSFGLVFNLFTSFGYFHDEAQNQSVFSETARILAPTDGHFVFDHINPAWLKTHLVPQSERNTPSGMTVRETRTIDLEKSRVQKRIEFTLEGKPREILESVRFYEAEEIRLMAARAGLALKSCFGDFDGSPLTADSPRAIYIFQVQIPAAPPDDEGRMRLALAEARKGAEANEVPVGAIVVDPEGRVLAAAHDERMAQRDPTAHAEILALRRAGASLGDWRLEDCDLYVTLEPCPMCAGALILSRLRRVVYGADSPKSGAVTSHLRLLDVESFNHRVLAQGGVLAQECGALLKAYFKSKR